MESHQIYINQFHVLGGGVESSPSEGLTMIRAGCVQVLYLLLWVDGKAGMNKKTLLISG